MTCSIEDTERDNPDHTVAVMQAGEVLISARTVDELREMLWQKHALHFNNPSIILQTVNDPPIPVDRLE